MYDTLLFLHVLSAAILFITVATGLSWAFGAQVDVTTARLDSFGNAVGGMGVLIFGVWLALNVDGYELWDTWIIIALVLWIIGAAAGGRLERVVREAVGSDGNVVALPSQAVPLNWIRIAAMVLLLADMVWKPFL